MEERYKAGPVGGCLTGRSIKPTLKGHNKGITSTLDQ